MRFEVLNEQNKVVNTVLADVAFMQNNFANYRVIEDGLEANLMTPVPIAVTMRQARLALLAAGKLSAVAPAIAAMPSPAKEQAGIEWEYSITVERQRPFVLQLGPALGMDAAALDALFIAAAKL